MYCSYMSLSKLCCLMLKFSMDSLVVKILIAHAQDGCSSHIACLSVADPEHGRHLELQRYMNLNWATI